MLVLVLVWGIISPGTKDELPIPITGEALPVVNPQGPDNPSSPAAVDDGPPYETYLPTVSFADTFSSSDSWSMAGANAERTSWVATGVQGNLRPVWYRPIEPLIPAKAQIVTSGGMLFVSTARGLLALNASNGEVAWFYATELPLGHSPTIAGGVAYVGGMDKRIHAVNARSGQRIWTFQASAGFDTNPVVAEGKVFMGSRDGYFYAVNASNGSLAWSYKTGGPIHFSAAYKNGVLFFASNDQRAYALRAGDGALVWRTNPLPGAGFHSWWPTIYQNYVIFTGTSGYRTNIGPADRKDQFDYEIECAVGAPKPSGTFPLGSMVDAVWMDNSKVQDCLERYPDRRTYFVLEQATGRELTMDIDSDGKPEYAPIFWFGTHADNRYPAVLGSDGSVYQAMPFSNWSHMFRGQVGGWRLGTQMVSLPTGSTLAIDEPIAYSAGGSVIYWNHCCDRGAGAFDLSVMQTGTKQEWRYWSYDLNNRAPGYGEMYTSVDIDQVYGNNNGMYGSHGDQNPPIPYNGMVYVHRSNAIIAFGTTSGSPAKLAPFRPQPVSEAIDVDPGSLNARLVEEVTEILDAGHLRPGYGVSGNFNLTADFDAANKLMDNWHLPGDTIDTLLRALPYLPADLQTRTRAYIQKEWTDYPPYSLTHIGWQGAARESYVLPNEVKNAMANSGPSLYANHPNFVGWQYPPQRYYTMWKYFQTFGNNKAIFDSNRNKLGTLPADSYLNEMPHILNAYIAGYWGYLELEKMSGYAETASYRSTLNRLLSMRANNFTKDSPYGAIRCDAGGISADCYAKSLNVSRNFMYMTPELANHLRANALSKVQAAVDEYNRYAPYWFASRYEQTYAEGVFQPLEDSHSVFQARALILQQPYSELVKYLDAPAVERGDLYYIDNLVAALKASGQ